METELPDVDKDRLTDPLWWRRQELYLVVRPHFIGVGPRGDTGIGMLVPGEVISLMRADGREFTLGPNPTLKALGPADGTVKIEFAQGSATVATTHKDEGEAE